MLGNTDLRTSSHWLVFRLKYSEVISNGSNNTLCCILLLLNITIVEGDNGLDWMLMVSSSILQSLRLHLDFSGLGHKKKGHGSGDLECADTDAWATAYRSVAAGAALIAGIGVMAYLKRSAS